MGWWQERKARKKLISAGLDKGKADEIIKELTEGYKGVIAARDSVEAQESEEYSRITNTLKYIGQSNTTREHKKLIATKLIEESNLSDEKKHDLLQRVERTYET